jgi:DNA-binding NtrC family response regulator
MPAQIVVVHDDSEFLDRIVTALRTAGYDVASFTDTMAATNALEQAHLMDMLITRVRFPAGMPPGPALARMTLVKRPGVRVLFVGDPANEGFTEGVGEFLPTPTTAAEVVAMVERMLAG